MANLVKPPIDRFRANNKTTKTELISAGAYNCSELLLGRLISDDTGASIFHEVVDLRIHTNSYSITQSLGDNNITLVIRVADSLRMLERLGPKGLQGEEFVKCKIQSPKRENKDEIIDLLFHVAYIGDISIGDNNSSEAFDLVCVTKEKLLSDLSIVNRHFKETETEIVKNIFSNTIKNSPKAKQLKAVNQFKDRTLFTTTPPSVGIEDIIIPGLNPMSAFDFLARRAFGGPSLGSYFEFFENSKGFYFANIEQLINLNKGRGAVFNHNPAQHLAATHDSTYYRHIEVLGDIKMPSTANRLINGTLSHSVRKLDYIKKKHNDIKFNMKDSYDGFEQTGKFNLTDKFFDTFANEQPYEYTVLTDSTASEDHVEHIVGKRLAYMDMLNSYQLQIVVYGDTGLNVGDVISINLPEPGSHEEKSTDSLYSGFWFVTGVKHSFDASKMNTTLNLSKSGLNEPHTDNPTEG